MAHSCIARQNMVHQQNEQASWQCQPSSCVSILPVHALMSSASRVFQNDGNSRWHMIVLAVSLPSEISSLSGKRAQATYATAPHPHTDPTHSQRSSSIHAHACAPGAYADRTSRLNCLEFLTGHRGRGHLRWPNPPLAIPSLTSRCSPARSQLTLIPAEPRLAGIIATPPAAGAQTTSGATSACTLLCRYRGTPQPPHPGARIPHLH